MRNYAYGSRNEGYGTRGEMKDEGKEEGMRGKG